MIVSVYTPRSYSRVKYLVFFIVLPFLFYLFSRMDTGVCSSYSFIETHHPNRAYLGVNLLFSKYLSALCKIYQVLKIQQ